jgi:hypothetical protein
MPVPGAAVDGEKWPNLYIGEIPDEKIDARSVSTLLKSKKNELVALIAFSSMRLGWPIRRR